jgi:hypothetical protein
MGTIMTVSDIIRSFKWWASAIALAVLAVHLLSFLMAANLFAAIPDVTGRYSWSCYAQYHSQIDPVKTYYGPNIFEPERLMRLKSLDRSEASFYLEKLIIPFQENLTSVVDLPSISKLESPRNFSHINLGYHYTFEGGEWVGYIDSCFYYEMTPKILPQILKLANLNALPPVPHRSIFLGFPYYTLFAIAAFAIAVTILLLMGFLQILTLFNPKLVETIEDQIERGD